MKKRNLLLSLATVPFIIIGCGGGSSSDTTTTSGIANISGTVPGTLIEAFCADGSYYRVNSNNNGTTEHPFTISVPQGVECKLVMTTNENDPANRVITPIGFINGGAQGTTLSLSGDLNMGNIPLAMSPAEISDANGDHVADQPHYHDLGDTAVARVTGTPVLDTDGDGIIDPYEDNDNDRIVNAYEDDDHDGQVNLYDDDDGNAHPDYLDDNDHDGTPNYIDDDNHDNTPDYVENSSSRDDNGASSDDMNYNDSGSVNEVDHDGNDNENEQDSNDDINR